MRNTVVVVSAARLERVGFKQLLKNCGFKIQREVSNVEDLISCGDRQDHPSLVISCVNLDDRAPAELASLRTVREAYPKAKLVVLSDVVSLNGMRHAMDVGVDGLLSAELPDQTLKCSLELILLGEVLFPVRLMYRLQESRIRQPIKMAPEGSSIAKSISEPEPPVNAMPDLSDREKQVLHALTLGLSSKAIARKFEVAETTIKIDIRGVLRKINVTNRTQAAIWAVNNHCPLLTT